MSHWSLVVMSLPMIAAAEPSWRRVLERQGVEDARVLSAFDAVSRAEFLDPDVRPFTWEDRPLTIGHGQTTSQPSLIAMTLQTARIGPGTRVLEVGSGCGYQTALLSKMGARVHAIDIVEPLVKRAQTTLERLGIKNVALRAGDGYLGWPSAAPFDVIIVAAGAARVPQPLLAQLAPGGRLIIPVGSPDAMELEVHTKQRDAGTHTRVLMPVRFVPLTGVHADADRIDAGHL